MCRIPLCTTELFLLYWKTFYNSFINFLGLIDWSWLQFSPNTTNLIILQIAVNFKRIISCYWIVSLVGKDQLWTEWVGINVYKLLRSSICFHKKRRFFVGEKPYRSKQENRNRLSIFKEMCIKIFKKTTTPNYLQQNALSPIAVDVSNKMNQSKLDASIYNWWLVRGNMKDLSKTYKIFWPIIVTKF